MSGDISELWSTLGYDALQVIWGIDEQLRNLSEDRLRELTAFTVGVQSMPARESDPLFARVHQIQSGQDRMAALQLLAEGWRREQSQPPAR
jgi:hypothetical protein